MSFVLLGFQKTEERIQSQAGLTPSHSPHKEGSRGERERSVVQHAWGSPQERQQETLARAVERAQRKVCEGVRV